MDNIILIGFMGCGKTSVGERLAKQCQFVFADTDALIEAKEKCTIKDIFAVQGEAYFRQAEEDMLKSLLTTLDHAVLSTGGGMPIREANQALLKKLGMVVYLRTTKETIIHRVKSDTTRPLLAGDDLEYKVDTLLTKRAPIYEACADVIVDTDGLDFEQVIDKILVAHRK